MLVRALAHDEKRRPGRVAFACGRRQTSALCLHLPSVSRRCLTCAPPTATATTTDISPRTAGHSNIRNSQSYRAANRKVTMSCSASCRFVRLRSELQKRRSRKLDGNLSLYRARASLEAVPQEIHCGRSRLSLVRVATSLPLNLFAWRSSSAASNRIQIDPLLSSGRPVQRLFD